MQIIIKIIIINVIVPYHRLNGSSSPVLTATSLSYGKAKNSTPHRIKTPDRIEIKFSLIDYARGPVMQNFMQIPPRGASRQMGEIYANFFIDVCEIFASIGGFRGWAIECCQLHFLPTDPRCHGNEIWNKIGYNSVCVRNICEIFASIGGFLGMGH